MTLIPTNIAFTRLNDLSISTDSLETLTLNLMVEGIDYIIITVYKPPDSNTSVFTDNIIHVFQNALSLASGVIVLGDFNLPNISWSTPCHGSTSELLFKNQTIGLGLDQVVEFNTPGANTLDLVFVSNHNLIDSVKEQPPFGDGICNPPSDHKAILIQTEILTKKQNINFTFKNFHKADWLAMRIGLDYQNWPVALDPINSTIDCMVQTFTSILQSLVNVHVPTFRKTNSRSYCIHDPSIKKLFATERRLRLRLKRLNSGDCTNNRRLTETHLAKIRVSRQIKRLTGTSIRQKETNILKSKDYRKFWSYVKSKTKLSQSIPTLTDGSGNKLITDKAKVECLNKTFTFSGTTPLHNNPNTSKLFSFYPIFSPDIIINKIKKLPNNNAASFDKLPNKLLKNLNSSIAEPLSIIFTASYNSGVFPDAWKYAKIIPVHKKGDKSLPTNYRPISLNSTISKVFESIIKDSALSACLSLNKINPNQFGFLPGKSVNSQLLKCQFDWASNLDNRLDTDIIYLDLTKAFDSIPHDLIITKLVNLGFPNHFHTFINSYLTNRRQSVVINSTKSNPAPVHYGVPQGSVLGPFIFVLFINDLTNCIQHSKVLLYADDIKLYKSISTATDIDLLQSDLNTTIEWLSQNGLQISAHKSASLTIGSFSNIPRTYKVIETPIPPQDSFRDLGVIIDRNLSFTENSATVCNKANRQSNCMRTSFHTRDTNFRLQMFKTFSLPIIDFCSSVSYPSKWGDRKAIESVQRRFTKYLPNMYNRTYRDRCKLLNIHPIIIRAFINDLVCLYNLINHKLIDVDPADMITFAETNTRGHNLRIYKSHDRNGSAMSNFLPYRIMTVWNSLPEDVVYQPNAKSFKTALNVNIDLLYAYLENIKPNFLD